MKTPNIVKRHWGKLVLGFFLAVTSVAAINLFMVRSAASVTYEAVSAVPANNVGLLLGTSANLRSGAENLHFTTRIDAATDLFRAGKIRHIILSGDNSTPGYDEPTAMKNALIKHGVPEKAMTLDYAGFRTLDSMARARKVFGQQKVTIITEEFHSARAVFLARQFGLEPVVFCTEALPAAWNVKSGIREIGARAKAALDVYVLHRGPKFLGEQVRVEIREKT